MSKIAIKVKSTSEVVEAEKGRLSLNVGDFVLLETPQCKEIGVVIDKKLAENEEENSATEGESGEIEIIRKLTEKDLALRDELKKTALGMVPECQRKIDQHKLPMELLDAELSFDEKKLTFYFSASGRVDFRMLVSDLASTFKKLIRLQQVGARDEARCIGGCGRCGQVLCCQRFLKGDLDSITLEMAQIQNLASMGANRVTGACGKLMCCLSFELEEYKNAAKKLPKVGEKIKTSDGEATVLSINVMAKKAYVEFADGRRTEVEC